MAEIFITGEHRSRADFIMLVSEGSVGNTLRTGALHINEKSRAETLATTRFGFQF